MSTSWGNMSRGWRKSIEKLVRRGPTPEEVAEEKAARKERARYEAAVGVTENARAALAEAMEEDKNAAAGWLGVARMLGVA